MQNTSFFLAAWWNSFMTRSSATKGAVLGFFLVTAVSFGLGLGTACAAQIPSVTDTTAPPMPGVGHNYIQENVETVNPANGSVSINIGVPLPPSRGFNLPFNISYNSGSTYYLGPLQDQQSGFGFYDTVSPLSEGGWNYGLPMLSVQDSPFSWVNQYPDGYVEPAPVTCDMWTDYVFQDASGGRTNLGIAVPAQDPVCAQAGNGPPIPLNAVKTLISSQVGPYLAATDPTWNGPSFINPVDVQDADGLLGEYLA